jgi:hypothetical protein
MIVLRLWRRARPAEYGFDEAGESDDPDSDEQDEARPGARWLAPGAPDRRDVRDDGYC